MSSIPYVCAALQTVLTTVANTAARSTGFIQRQRQLTGAGFVQALVFGFLAKPTLSLDQLAQTAPAVGSPISAQGLDQRFTSQAATCLRAVLGAAVQQMVTANRVAIPLLQRFTGVYLLDRADHHVAGCAVHAVAGQWRQAVRWDVGGAESAGPMEFDCREFAPHWPAGRSCQRHRRPSPKRTAAAWRAAYRRPRLLCAGPPRHVDDSADLRAESHEPACRRLRPSGVPL